MWYVGMKVVCVDDDSSADGYPPGVVLGEKYTVAGIGEPDVYKDKGLILKEIRARPRPNGTGAFRSTRFQPFTGPRPHPEGDRVMTKPFDQSRPVQTRAGQPARIVCTDVKQSGYPIFALIGQFESESGYYTREGKSSKHKYSDGPLDLINVPEKHTRWMNLSRDGGGNTHATFHVSRQAADTYVGDRSRIACIRIEFSEGDGL